MPKIYTPKELEKMLYGLQENISLEELEIRGRTSYGIAVKMRQLSKEYPDIWNPQRVKSYIASEIRAHKRNRSGKKYCKGNVKEQKRRWRERQIKNRNALSLIISPTLSTS